MTHVLLIFLDGIGLGDDDPGIQSNRSTISATDPSATSLPLSKNTAR